MFSSSEIGNHEVASSSASTSHTTFSDTTRNERIVKAVRWIGRTFIVSGSLLMEEGLRMAARTASNASCESLFGLTWASCARSIIGHDLLCLGLGVQGPSTFPFLKRTIIGQCATVLGKSVSAFLSTFNLLPETPFLRIPEDQGNQEDKSEVLTLDQIQHTLDGLKERLGIVEPIELRENTTWYDPIYSHTRKIFPWDHPGIQIYCPYLSKMTEGEREFCLLHELAHIKNRDGNKTTIANLATLPQLLLGFIILLRRMGDSPSLSAQVFGSGLVWLSTRITITAVKQLEEIRADREAFLACSIKGKQGAFTFLDKAEAEELSCGWGFRAITYPIIFFYQGVAHPLPIHRKKLLQKLV